MTGEITPEGKVLQWEDKGEGPCGPQGRHQDSYSSKWNEKDLDEIQKVQKSIAFHFVDKMTDVLKIALERRESSRQEKDSGQPPEGLEEINLKTKTGKIAPS